MPGPHYMLNKFLMISIMGMYSWKRTWKWSASISSFYKYDNEPREKWWLKQSKSEIKHHVWNSAVQSPSSSTVVSLISLLFCIISITLFPAMSLSLSLSLSLFLSLSGTYKTLCSFGFTNLNFLQIWETITSISVYLYLALAM